MADAVASAPINATSTGTVPAPSADRAPEAKTPKAPQKQFASKMEETLWRVNEPTADEAEDSQSMSNIIDSATANAGKSSKEATSGRTRKDDGVSTQDEVQKEKLASEKKKYTVNGKEYELSAEQADRFAQKGIMHELKNRDAAEKQRGLAAKEKEIVQREQESARYLEALKQNSLDVLIDMHGEDKARELMEGWLRPRIEKEMMPPEERQQLEWRERAERAESQLQQREHQTKQQQIEAQAQHFEQEYQRTILTALQKGGFPEGADLTPFAVEMASWMERGLEKNIEYTPEQLVQLVQQDNNLRVRSLTGVYVSQINAAKAKGDEAGIVKMGEQLVGILGEPVMHAIGKYHLAKMRNGQPAVPQPVLDTPKAPVRDKNSKPKRYMSEDEYAAKRRERVAAMERGEHVPDWDDQ